VLVTFQKLLDPTSVVRESEYARSGDGQSIKQRMQGTYEKLLRGGAGVTQAELKSFYDLSTQLLEGYNDEQVNTLRRTRAQADNWGLELNNIITPEATKLLEADDSKRLSEYYNNNPAEQPQIERMINENPDISDYDILRVLGTGFSQPLSLGENSSLDKLASSLITQESGGNYQAVGDVPAGYAEADRALGKYQIVPKYHFDKIGLANTASDRQKFLNSPQLQDQLFQQILQGLSDQYNGDIRKIAAAYYGGGGGASVVGTPAGDKPQYAGGKAYPSINQYVNSVVGRLS
jgi:hypothetical protein